MYNLVPSVPLCFLNIIIFYNTPMISALFHACGAGPQSRFSSGVSTNWFVVVEIKGL